MTYGETIKMLDSLAALFVGGGDDSAFSPAQKRWISTLYKSETGEAVRECGCKNKYTDAVLYLRKRLRERGQLESDCTYRLRRGVLIWIGNDAYNCHNLTDDVAREWLRQHPDGRDLFE